MCWKLLGFLYLGENDLPVYSARANTWTDSHPSCLCYIVGHNWFGDAAAEQDPRGGVKSAPDFLLLYVKAVQELQQLTISRYSSRQSPDKAAGHHQVQYCIANHQQVQQLAVTRQSSWSSLCTVAGSRQVRQLYHYRYSSYITIF